MQHEAAFSKCILNACEGDRTLCKCLSYESVNSDREAVLQDTGECRKLDESPEMTVARDENINVPIISRNLKTTFLIFWLCCHL